MKGLICNLHATLISFRNLEKRGVGDNPVSWGPSQIDREGMDISA
jgi:hypothetical protein